MTALLPMTESMAPLNLVNLAVSVPGVHKRAIEVSEAELGLNVIAAWTGAGVQGDGVVELGL